MRHVRMLGLCLAAVIAVGAYVASSALAGPQWVKCEAQAGGKYKNSNCTEKAKKGEGAYELLNAAKVGAKRVAEGKSKNVPFTGANLGSGGVLQATFRPCLTKTEGLGRLTRQGCVEKGIESNLHETPEYGEEQSKAETFTECTAERNSGETSGSSGVTNVKVVFTGCSEFGGALLCNSPGAAEGEVRVNTLKGKLGYISKSEHKVGMLLEPATKHGKFAEFVCGGIASVAVGVGNEKEGAEYTSTGCFELCPGTTPAEEKHGGYDGIISRIEPVNEMTSEFKQVYTTKDAWGHGLNSEAYQNVPSHFEGKHIELLEAYLFSTEHPTTEQFDWSAAGEEITNSSRPEEAGEIKA